MLREGGTEPVTLHEVLAHSQIVFVLATVTDSSTHLLAVPPLSRLPYGAGSRSSAEPPSSSTTRLAEQTRNGRIRVSLPDESPPALTIRDTPRLRLRCERVRGQQRSVVEALTKDQGRPSCWASANVDELCWDQTSIRALEGLRIL